MSTAATMNVVNEQMVRARMVKMLGRVEINGCHRFQFCEWQWTANVTVL